MSKSVSTKVSQDCSKFTICPTLWWHFKVHDASSLLCLAPLVVTSQSTRCLQSAVSVIIFMIFASFIAVSQNVIKNWLVISHFYWFHSSIFIFSEQVDIFYTYRASFCVKWTVLNHERWWMMNTNICIVYIILQAVTGHLCELLWQFGDTSSHLSQPQQLTAYGLPNQAMFVN